MLPRGLPHTLHLPLWCRWRRLLRGRLLLLKDSLLLGNRLPLKERLHLCFHLLLRALFPLQLPPQLALLSRIVSFSQFSRSRCHLDRGGWLQAPKWRHGQ
jgi:hypothetical protein